MKKSLLLVDICERLDVDNNYVGVLLDRDIADSIKSHLGSIGIEDSMDPEEMHATIMYSKEPMSSTSEVQSRHSARVVGYDLFGSTRDTLVALLDSSDLKMSHYIGRGRGGVPTYDEYRPHLTLKENATESDLQIIRSNPLKGNLVSLSFSNSMI